MFTLRSEYSLDQDLENSPLLLFVLFELLLELLLFELLFVLFELLFALFELLFVLFGVAGEFLELRTKKTIPPTTRRATTGMIILSKLFGFFCGTTGAPDCGSVEKGFVAGTLEPIAEEIASVCMPGVGEFNSATSGVVSVGMVGAAAFRSTVGDVGSIGAAGVVVVGSVMGDTGSVGMVGAAAFRSTVGDVGSIGAAGVGPFGISVGGVPPCGGVASGSLSIKKSLISLSLLYHILLIEN